MKRPTSQKEIDRYVQPVGDRYKANRTPPWKPGDGRANWTWEKTIFGAWFEREPNLPYCCDPSFERYWSM